MREEMHQGEHAGAPHTVQRAAPAIALFASTNSEDLQHRESPHRPGNAKRPASSSRHTGAKYTIASEAYDRAAERQIQWVTQTHQRRNNLFDSSNPSIIIE